ncbi:MAG: ABC transporter substrate-binding protein [Oceanospirillaceae bacterium]
MLHKCFTPFSIIILVLSLARPILANDTLVNDTLAKGTLVNEIIGDELVLVSGEWPPYVGKKLNKHGFITELVSAAFLNVKVATRFKWLPWIRAESSVRKHAYFAAFPYAKTAERSAEFYFSEPIYFAQGIFFYNTLYNKDIKFEQLSDLKELRIGAVRGNDYTSLFKNTGLNLFLVNNAKQLIDMLQRNRLDLIAINRRSGWSLINRFYPSQKNSFATLSKPLNKKHGIHLMISKEFPNALSLTKKFNTGLKNIQYNGTYIEIVHRSLFSKNVQTRHDNPENIKIAK